MRAVLAQAVPRFETLRATFRQARAYLPKEYGYKSHLEEAQVEARWGALEAGCLALGARPVERALDGLVSAAEACPPR